MTTSPVRLALVCALVGSPGACGGGSETTAAETSDAGETAHHPDAATPSRADAGSASHVADAGHSHDAAVAVDASGTITVTRAACTPFGAPPRPLNTSENALFQPTCTGGGTLLSDFVDSEGTTRLACLYTPSGVSPTHPLPLIMFVHPSVVGPNITAALSGIQASLATADLSADPSSPGFVLLEPAGRVVDDRYYPFPDQSDSPGWDNWNRQLSPAGDRTVNGTVYPENVDAASFDHYLAEVVASGNVDPKRIFVMGWSNGSSMGMLYALNRPNIAAAAIYSAPDPFHAFNDPCPQLPVATAPTNDTEIQMWNPGVPIYHVHNACDIAGTCPNAEYTASALLSASVDTISDQILTDSQASTTSCNDACGTSPYAYYGALDDLTGYAQDIPGDTEGVANHIRWPSDWTTTMFTYLREHPLP